MFGVGSFQPAVFPEHKQPPNNPTDSHHDSERKNHKSSLYVGNIILNTHILQHLQQHARRHSDSHQQVQDSKPHKVIYPSNRSCSPQEPEHTFEQWDTSSVPREICDALLKSTIQNIAPADRASSSSNSYKQTTGRPNSEAPSLASISMTVTTSKPSLVRQQSSDTPRKPHKDSILPDSPNLTSSPSSSSLPSTPYTRAYRPRPPSAYSCSCISHPPIAATRHQHRHDLHTPLPRPKFTPRRPRAHSFEDNIHPLFRTSSPEPPPGTTRGTVVTASPVAGQTISKNTLSRIKSGSFSLPVSSSPLAQTAMMDLDIAGDRVDEGAQEGDYEDDDTTTRTEMPIPGFVLAAGNRGSWVDYGKRKSSRGPGRDDGR
ncbi:hypothetical protein I7I51_06722 [Histoplasma capsulatum]|uniref:Uncharacterized protein n=1 Tax=Ajellomyces capsulatus TaxID=5037 RepID=A0A8A1MII6_AJECA|nr:predicted protein [Histoplasma mississippiense (nom. inval.)]EDN06344.1 predicted protein [Histoplasma mississippiense (nom. inval.)]QSS65871.1 hypothetical protein I7I51_06722 [Histoplasma capsulatum]